MTTFKSFTGNIGEWSELYVFVKLLSEGVLYGSDEHLTQQYDLAYNILSIFREHKEFIRDNNTQQIRITHTDNSDDILIDISEFEESTDLLLEKMPDINNKNNRINDIETFLHKLNISKIKADNQSKGDITIKIFDTIIGSEPILDFSIKSQFGKPATLLNASKATNFIYKVTPSIPTLDLDRINNLTNSRKQKVNPPIKINEINKLGSELVYHDMASSQFKFNLKMIDYEMPKIMSEIMYIANKKNISSLNELFEAHLDHLSEEDKLLYEYKTKNLLMNSALGMIPSRIWNGNDEANGGYIIVKSDGELACFHLYNRNALRDYLFKNTKFEKGSKERHDYGYIYTKGYDQFMAINLSFRFNV